MASNVTSFSLHGKCLAASGDKAFVVGLGQATIVAKLLKKITSSEFEELANFSATPVYCVQGALPHCCGCLLVGSSMV